MKIRMAVAASVLALSATACAREQDAIDTDGAWVGTITTEGDVTTVVNESGSVWGGTATLVEEASIGVDVGADEYMFGYISGVYAAHDRIWVVDNQAPAVRMYDREGEYLGDLGGPGEGPGEFVSPFWLGGTPDGRIFVQAPRNGRVNVYTSDGEVLPSIPLGTPYCCVYPMVVTPDGVPWVPVRHFDQETMRAAEGIRKLGPDGPRGPVLEPPGVGYRPIPLPVGERRMPVVFSPENVWVATPWKAIVGGVSDAYRFQIRSFDGRSTVVERHYEPVPVAAEERDWWRRYIVASTRRREPDWTWNGAEIPPTKPAFHTFIPTADGKLWVIREGSGIKQPDCLEHPTVDNIEAVDGRNCWRGDPIIDVFGADGRFSGSIENPPHRLWLAPQAVHVRGDTIVAVAFDGADTFLVKRYRLVLPEEK